MHDAGLLEKIKQLKPSDLEDLELYIDLLLQKAQAVDPHAERKPGFGKHLILYIADDFDEPLEEFEPYM